MHYRSYLSFAIITAFFISSAAIHAAEEKTALKDVPQSVIDAVKKRFPKGELTEGAKEEEDGKTFYEVSVKQAGKNIDVSLTPEGVITMIEKQMDSKDLPKVVSSGVEKKYPKPKYEIAEEVTVVQDGKEKLSYYEVLVSTTDGKKVEIQVELDGKLKKEEDKSADKDDEKDEDKEKAKEKDTSKKKVNDK